jgi:hypothetical protein
MNTMSERATHGPHHRLAWHREWAGLVCTAFLLGCYIVTLPLTLTEADSGEWLVIARVGGVPHPSGYPLYATLCRAVASIAPASLALVTSVAAISAVCGAIAAWISYGALRESGIERVIAAVATTVVFTSTPVWRIANLPEPFALALLLASGVLLLAARTEARRRDRHDDPATGDVLVLGLIFGLGFCSHHMLVWMVPLGLYVLMGQNSTLTRSILAFARGFSVGLLPLLYFAWAMVEESPYDVWVPDNVGAIVHLLLRRSYGTFTLTKGGGDEHGAALWYFVRHLPEWLSWGFAVPAILGSVVLARRFGAAMPSRGMRVAWLASLLFSTVVFLSLFGVAIESFIPAIIERFMWLGAWLLLIPIAIGLRLSKDVARGHRRLLWTTALFVGVCGHAWMQCRASDRRRDGFYEEHARSVLAIADRFGDTLIVSSDAETFGALYGAHVLGLGGKDLWILNAAQWSNRRFAQRTVARWGLPTEFARQSVAAFVSELVARRGHVVVADPPLPPRPSVFRHSFILGPTIVLVSPREPLPNDDLVWSMNDAFFQEIQGCHSHRRGGPWSEALWQKYQTNLAELADGFETRGRLDLARRARARLERTQQCDEGENGSENDDDHAADSAATTH